MDQKTLDNIFTPTMHLDIILDVMNGRKLQQHQVTIVTAIEAADFIIEQEGVTAPGVDDVISIKEHLDGMALHIERGLNDPTYRPAFIID